VDGAVTQLFCQRAFIVECFDLVTKHTLYLHPRTPRFRYWRSDVRLLKVGRSVTRFSILLLYHTSGKEWYEVESG
jgi:membrane protein required for beta-lactamase induction